MRSHKIVISFCNLIQLHSYFGGQLPSHLIHMILNSVFLLYAVSHFIFALQHSNRWLSPYRLLYEWTEMTSNVLPLTVSLSFVSKCISNNEIQYNKIKTWGATHTEPKNVYGYSRQNWAQFSDVSMRKTDHRHNNNHIDKFWKTKTINFHDVIPIMIRLYCRIDI